MHIRGNGVIAALLLASCGTAAAHTDYLHPLDTLKLKSHAVIVVDQDTGETLADKNADLVVPVASLTKLMTALVVLESGLPGDERLEVGSEDVDRDKRTPSRLTVGTRLTRDELLVLALMASENRASLTLSRHYPGGRPAFLARMNARARDIGMANTYFADPAGLSDSSVSTARDVHKLVTAAYAEPVIRQYSTRRDFTVRVGGKPLKYGNSNRLVRQKSWDIGLQKTGYTLEAGRCLALHARVGNRNVAMIFLDSWGKLTRYADAARVRQGVERLDRKKGARPTPTAATTGAAP
jgi:D-alanyl-D-alanine endopeptidase (penicillin-binding protein 7)